MAEFMAAGIEIGSMGESSGSVALVTGATGFIGGRLAERLVHQGVSVRLLVRDAKRLAPSLRGVKDVITGDLGDGRALGLAVRGAAVIYHCAANVSTWDTAEGYQAANILGVKNLLRAISQENPRLSRLVHVSTVDVYGFPKEPCNEQCKTTPSGFGYGDSKRLGEIMVRDFGAASGNPYTIIRPANVIGPGSPFIGRIGDALESGVMLTINGGRANAGFIYIDNLVDYLIWAADAGNAVGKCYNVRDQYDVDWATFLARFRKLIKGRGLVIDLPFGAANSVAQLIEAFYQEFLPSHEPLLHRLLVRLFGRTCGHSAEKIRADSGLKGRVGFDEAMERSIQWFLEARGVLASSTRAWARL
jgi:nucleoside-diphosphate-sugar epimerase